MKFNLMKFVLIGGFSGAVVFGGIYFGLQRFNQRNITPYSVDQRTIDQQTIDQRQLSAVRDLKGTWEGHANFVTNQNGRCDMPGTLILTINNQNENTISGNYTLNYQSGKYHAPAGWKSHDCTPGTSTDSLNGNISGTSVNITLETFGLFSGSYTQDTLTLNEVNPLPDSYGGIWSAAGVINLLRKK